MHRIQECIDIANSPNDQRSSVYTDVVNAALDRAGLPDIDDPSPGRLTSWRTAGH
jgi:hypothetical protein